MESLWLFFLEPFSFPFMQKAFFLGLLISSTCAVFSCFLILKGWSLMGDAISHSILPGIGIAYILGLPLFLGAFGAGIFCAFMIFFVKNNSHLKEDVVMGVIFSGMFAFGLVILTKIETDVHLLHIILGNILGLSGGDILEVVLMSSLSFFLFFLKGKDLLLYCFDPVQAYMNGLSTKRIHFLLLILLSLTIVSALKAVGVILVIAMLIIPGAIAFLLSQSFKQMLIIAVVSSIFAVLLGIILSFHLDISTAPMIVCIQSFLFLIALFVKRKNYEKKRNLLIQ